MWPPVRGREKWLGADLHHPEAGPLERGQRPGAGGDNRDAMPSHRTPELAEDYARVLGSAERFAGADQRPAAADIGDEAGRLIAPEPLVTAVRREEGVGPAPVSAEKAQHFFRGYRASDRWCSGLSMFEHDRSLAAIHLSRNNAGWPRA